MKNNIKKINIDIQNSNLGLEKDNDLKVAIYDIVNDNIFYLLDFKEKEYNMNIKVIENLLILNLLTNETSKTLTQISLNLKSINKILKEYVALCNSYYDAIKSAPVQKVEALDMGRRSLHDDASHELLAKLEQYAYMDFNTARRFITFLSIVYRKTLVGENIFN
tara:strand:+ start:6705 stop:7196 length:492 start_codon:yes stop_codon:yes gene_type:complete